MGGGADWQFDLRPQINRGLEAEVGWKPTGIGDGLQC